MKYCLNAVKLMDNKKIIEKIKEIIQRKNCISENDFRELILVFKEYIWNRKAFDYQNMEEIYRADNDRYVYIIPDKITLVYYTDQPEISKSTQRLESELITAYQTEWGILISKEGIYLLNRDIEVDMKKYYGNKVVFSFMFQSKHDLEYLGMLDWEKMFGRYRNIYFYRDMITYRNVKFTGSNKSWMAYHTAMKRFFRYYITQKEWNSYCNNYNNIRFQDFKRYMKEATGIKSSNTVRSQFLYIKDFILYMADENEDFNIGGKAAMEQCLNEIDYEANRSRLEETDFTKIEKIIKYLGSKKTEKYRTVFLLLLCYGLERRKLCTLKWKDFSENFEFYFLEKKNERKVAVPFVLRESLMKLRDETRSEGKIEPIYVIGNKHSKYLKPISEERINDMMLCINKIDYDDDFYRKMIPSNIRKWLFKHLLHQGYSLQDVMKLMGISVANLGNYIGDEELWKYTSESLKNKSWIDV